MFHKVVLVFIFCLGLAGCSTGKLFYIENDNYSKYYNYYINNIKPLDSKQYKFIAIFNDKYSYNLAKNRINLIKKELLNKVDIYVIILYPYGKEKSQEFKDIFSYLDNLYSNLKAKKQYKNNLYTVGVPQQNTKYKVLIYFKKLNKEK